MYDFYFGSDEEIQLDEGKFLLTIKRMLPRWINGIPDSEFLTIFEILQQKCRKDRPVLVETGVGASTVALLHCAFKYDGVLYSWDMAGPKGAYLRGVCTDTLQRYHKKDIFKHWKFIAYNSLSSHLGLPILTEVTERVDMCFLDSEHILQTLVGEIAAMNSLFADGSVVSIDDANYTWRHTNYAYINMFRRKLQLPELESPPDNIGPPFWMEVERYLTARWSTVTRVDEAYKNSFKEDLFWAYFNAERQVMARTGMEKLSELENRFAAWQISGRKKSP